MINLKTIGVAGAGVMGSGVAQSLAQTDHQVILVDHNPEQLETARANIRQAVRLQYLFDAGESVRPDPDQVVARITFTTSLQAMAQADFVIENITEKVTLKEPLYRQLDQICPAGTMFAADTSAIPITQLASFTSRPEKVIGIHFMNPVPMKAAVEVIRGTETDEETIAATLQLLSQMGKEGILVNDAPGFVSNRVLMLTINEAINVVGEGVASPLEVDQIFKQCFGHKMGPLETGDLIGLDTILLTLEVLQQNFPGEKFAPARLLVEMVEEGRLGQKSGQGFYRYAAGTRLQAS